MVKPHQQESSASYMVQTATHGMPVIQDGHDFVIYHDEVAQTATIVEDSSGEVIGTIHADPISGEYLYAELTDGSADFQVHVNSTTVEDLAQSLIAAAIG